MDGSRIVVPGPDGQRKIDRAEELILLSSGDRERRFLITHPLRLRERAVRLLVELGAARVEP